MSMGLCLWYPLHNITNVPPSSTSVEDVKKRTLKCTPTPALCRQEKGALKQLLLEVLAERETSGVLKRRPFPQVFLYVNPHSLRVPFLSEVSIYGATLLQTNPL